MVQGPQLRAAAHPQKCTDSEIQVTALEFENTKEQ